MRNPSLPAPDVLFDTWAWWEYLGGTPTGKRLARRYVSRPGLRLHTSILSLAEISAKLASAGQSVRTRAVLSRIEARSHVHAVPRDVVEGSGAVRAALRRRDPAASVLDALILATARHVGATLISADPAFAGEPDVQQR
jgi:predicted nucleic acid-binding protein